MNFIKKYYGILIILVGILGFMFLNNAKGNEMIENPINFSDENMSLTTMENGYVMIYIKGEVKYPGLYEVTNNLRIGDVILVAGGLTENADINNLNLAQKITDEMEINVPKKQSANSSEYVKMIKVEIKGEVNEPGIYSLPLNSRIEDLIDACNGLTEKADDENLNMAQILSDGDLIIVPAKVEETKTTNMIYVKIQGEIKNPDVYYVENDATLQELIYLAGGVTENADINRIDWDVKLCLGAVITIPSIINNDNDYNYSEYDENGKININYASVETLIQLPGIGDILAQRIIDYRSEFGNFLAIEDIMNVSGIKTTVYEEIKELITV